MLFGDGSGAALTTPATMPYQLSDETRTRISNARRDKLGRSVPPYELGRLGFIPEEVERYLRRGVERYLRRGVERKLHYPQLPSEEQGAALGEMA